VRKFTSARSAKVKQLYGQGYSDPSIALTVGVTRPVIRYWRLRNELPPNANGGRPRKDRTAEAKKKAAPRAGTSEDGK
jgi:transposase